MKKLLLLALLVSTASAYAQGTVAFLNRNLSYGIDALISFAPGGPAPTGNIDGSVAILSSGYTWGGINARAGLYGGPVGTPEDELLLLTPIVGFRPVLGAGIVDTGPYSSRTVPNVSVGSPGVFQIRAWDTGLTDSASYEEGLLIAQTRFVYLGKSPLVTLAALGGIPPSGPPQTPANLIGLQPFSLFLVGSENIAPEPSILVLLGLGVLSALCFSCSQVIHLSGATLDHCSNQRVS